MFRTEGKYLYSFNIEECRRQHPDNSAPHTTALSYLENYLILRSFNFMSFICSVLFNITGMGKNPRCTLCVYLNNHI